jgi:hypothetical protein
MKNSSSNTRARMKENNRKKTSTDKIEPLLNACRFLALKSQEKKILAPKSENLLKVFNLLKINKRLVGLQKPSFKKIEKTFNPLEAKKAKKRSIFLQKSFLKSIEDKKGFLKALKRPKTRRREKKGARRIHLVPQQKTLEKKKNHKGLAYLE